MLVESATKQLGMTSIEAGYYNPHHEEDFTEPLYWASLMVSLGHKCCVLLVV